MTILVKNKHRLLIDDFEFECCIGENGSTINKIEGDKKTPKGTFKIENLYYREDRIKKPVTSLKCIKIKSEMGWCNDINFPKKYNKLIKLPFSFGHEKLFKKNNSYDVVLVLNYNMKPIRKNKGSAIFIHIAKRNYKQTLGCVALSKTSILKIVNTIKKNTIVKISAQK